LPILFQNRLFLFGNEFDTNKGIYSAFDTVDVFNGEDSGELYLGSEQAIIAGGIIYNVFQTTGYEQLLLVKKSETYRIHGADPTTWEVQQLSTNVGCVAPASFVVCEIADVQKDLKRNVAIWQAAHGFVMCDAATIQNVSNDISVYFNSADSRSIPIRKITDTVSWYDPDGENYHALIASGADVKDTWGDGDTWANAPMIDWGINWEKSIDIQNVELVYSLRYNEWTKIYREDANGALPLQVGIQAKNTEGQIYTYGLTDNGYLYRLEYGKTWDGTPIDQYIHTKDIMFDDQKSVFNLTAVKRIRTLFNTKAAISGETIVVTHYGDGIKTVSGVSNQKTVEDIAMTATNGRNSQDVNLGEFLKHSFKFEAKTRSIDEGMELLGMGLWYESFDRWME
jgi:hypothetical protein